MAWELGLGPLTGCTTGRNMVKYIFYFIYLVHSSIYSIVQPAVDPPLNWYFPACRSARGTRVQPDWNSAEDGSFIACRYRKIIHSLPQVGFKTREIFFGHEVPSVLPRARRVAVLVCDKTVVCACSSRSKVCDRLYAQ